MTINDNITLYNEDCFSVLPNITEKVSLICCDPPYDIKASGKGGSVNKMLKLSEKLECLTEHTDLTQGYDIEGFSELVCALQGNDINAYFFCNKKQIPEYIRVYVGKLKCLFDILSWHKQNAIPSYSHKYLTDTEYVLYFHKGGGIIDPKSYEDAKTFYMGYINIKDKTKYGHPTIKPLSLVEKIVRNSSKEGDIVLDPFMGSGTTGVACILNNRKFIGCEIDPHYFDIAKRRIKGEQSQLKLF